MSTEVLHIEALAYGPAAIAHRGDGKAVFVEGGVPGDVVEAEIVQEKASFARARTVRVVEPSPQRVTPARDLAGLDAACPWMHVAYPAQLAAKHANVVDALARIGGMERERAQRLVEPTLGCKHEIAYRNKIELACAQDAQGRLAVGVANAEQAHDASAGGSGRTQGAGGTGSAKAASMRAQETGRATGKRAHGPGGPSPSVVPVKRFGLAHAAIAKAPGALQGALRYLEGADPGQLGIHRIGVRHSKRTGSCEVAVWTTPGPFPRKAVASTLSDALPATSIVRVLAEPGRARKIKGVEALAGNGCWHEKLAGIDYRVSAPSFFQVNTAQAEKLVETVVGGLGVSEGSRVADLYCGVGTFALPLAALDCDVSAVESSGPAVRDLRRNAEEAGLFVDIIGGDTARELPGLGQLDALVVDPPRAGLADGVAESIAAAAPERIAYVSCDPATWARDVARLANCGYSLERAVPIDLFPQTYHCELVSFFASK